MLASPTHSGRSLAARWILILGLLAAGALAQLPAAQAQEPSIEGNLAALALPPEAFPGYAVGAAEIDRDTPFEEHVVAYLLADQAAMLSQPFAIAVAIVLTEGRPAPGGADFVFANFIESFVDGFLRSAGSSEGHYESFDGQPIVSGARWTRLEYELGQVPGVGFLAGFPFDSGMAFVAEMGLFDTATADDTAALAEALAFRVGAL